MADSPELSYSSSASSVEFDGATTVVELTLESSLTDCDEFSMIEVAVGPSDGSSTDDVVESTAPGDVVFVS